MGKFQQTISEIIFSDKTGTCATVLMSFKQTVLTVPRLSLPKAVICVIKAIPPPVLLPFNRGFLFCYLETFYFIGLNHI